MPSVADLLADLKQRDGARASAASFAPVVLIDNDRTLARLVATWPNVPVSSVPDPQALCPDVDPGSQLRWLWSVLEPDPIPGWIRASGLPDAPHVRRACFVAIDNRIVHPDGSLAQWAERYVRQLVVERLGGE